MYSLPLAELERRRLGLLLAAWLEEEAARPPFKVIASESQQALQLGPLRLSIRIDRIDELADGGRLLLDYKSGRIGLQAWLDERPDEPQLPLYAIAHRERLKGLALASLKPGAMGFAGLATEAGLLDGVSGYAEYRYRPAGIESWDALLSWWERNLTRLAEEHAAGDARVAPKNADTCERCHLTMLCRVHTLADAPLQEVENER